MPGVPYPPGFDRCRTPGAPPLPAAPGASRVEKKNPNLPFLYQGMTLSHAKKKKPREAPTDPQVQIDLQTRQDWPKVCKIDQLFRSNLGKKLEWQRPILPSISYAPHATRDLKKSAC